MTRTDPTTLLVTGRPTDARLEELWPAAEREQILRRTLSRTSAPHVRAGRRALPKRRRAALLSGVAAAGAAAILAGPAVLSPTHAPQAAALTRLARVATSRPAVVIPAGRFWKMTVVEQPDGDPERAGYPQTETSWTDAAGNIWRRGSTATGTVDYAYFPHPEGNSVSYPSPAYARTLPTDAGALEAYLRARVHGGASKDEAIFTAVGDMVRLGYIPAEVRATAIRTLGRLPEVGTKSVTLGSRQPGLRVSFVDQRIRRGWVQSLIFDPETSRLVEESTTIRGAGSFTTAFLQEAVVATVPPTVRHRAVSYRE